MKKLFKYHEGVFVTLSSILLALFTTYPSIRTLSTKFIGDGGDNYEYASYIALASQNIKQGLFPFISTTFWRYPVGFDFSRGFDSYLTVTIGTLLSFFMNLVSAYNITVLILMALNGVLSYIFFKLLTSSRSLALIGMVMYGFSFYTIAKAASHPNLLFIGGFPLLGTALIQLIKNKSLELPTVALFFFSLLLISLGSAQYFILAVLFLAIYALLLFFFNRSLFLSILKKVNKKKMHFFMGSAITSCLFVLLFLPHLAALLTGKLVVLAREGTLATLTPSLTDYIFPNKYLHILPAKFVVSQSLPSIEKVVFVGFIELVFFVLFFVRQNITPFFKKSLFLLFLIPFTLSMGYGNDNSFFLLPYHFLADILPFSILVETGRYVVIFGFFITMAVLIFLKSIYSRKARYILSGIFLVVLLLERMPVGFYTTPSLDEKYAEVVKEQDSTAVLDIPINTYYPPYNVLSFHYQKPIVNGYFHWSADTNEARSFVSLPYLTHFACTKDSHLNTLSKEEIDSMVNSLKENDITTIVVHKDDKFYHPACIKVREELANLIPPVESVQPTSLDKEKEIVMTSITGKPQFNLYFPKSGTFYIGGLYLAPTDPTSFEIVKNNQPVIFSYSFVVANNFSMQIAPTHSISLEVNAGDTLTIQGATRVDSTYLSLWYRYVPMDNSSSLPLVLPFTKVYEDNKAIVYRLK